MMTNEQYLLGKLAEESAELAQIAIKAQQFGMEHVFGAQGDDPKSNVERISAELNDVLGIVHMLVNQCDANICTDPQAQMAKVVKTTYWRDRSPVIPGDTENPFCTDCETAMGRDGCACE